MQNRLSIAFKGLMAIRLRIRFLIFILFLVALLLLHLTGPVLDLALYIVGGLLTAGLTILGGHVSTDKLEYRLLFYVLGFALAAIIVSTGIRQYQAAIVALNAPTPEKIVMEAVEDANKHTDTVVEGANRHTDSQVAMVRDDLKDAKQQIGMVRDDLKGTISTVSELFKKTEDNLSVSIGKVGKPDPPTPPHLLLSLWSPTTPMEQPLLETSLRPNADGVFSIEFSIANVPPTSAAHSVDVWIDICTECTFAKEPEGFDRPTGMPDQTRHMMINLLNPGVTLAKKTIEVKLNKPFLDFLIQLRYACDVCGVHSGQQAKIISLPSLPKAVSQ